MDDEATEKELLAMLQEPTAKQVRRDQIKADVILQIIGRAMAPAINAMLADAVPAGAWVDGDTQQGGETDDV